MRVIGYIPHPVLKITVFETDSRYPVQFEAGTSVQTYRFRRGAQLAGLEDVKAVVDQRMIEDVLLLMRRQRKIESEALGRNVQNSGGEQDDLPSII